ncbi:MAG: DUF3817 domain-containing protein [Flavobacteriales bacterium]|jgi:integral membrane protein|nr:DUF3817 domain-containing protein [Flavobacteriales bacterium]
MNESPVITGFRFAARAEGISYLVLLLVAMPLKYLADMPLAVTYVGWAHGALFVWYWIKAVPLFTTLKWDLERLVGLAAASVVPFGTFVMEARWLRPAAPAAR